MKFSKLRLQNFVSYEDCEIDLSKVSFCSIVGPNGSGKSTLIEAIIWALYGTAKIANKDLVRTGEAKMSVCLDVELNGKLHSIQRGFNGKAMSIKLEVDGEEVAQGKANQSAEIVKAVGITRELLLQSMAITQGQLSSFVNAYPSERRDLIMEMLDMSRYGKAYQVARDAQQSMSSIIGSHQGTVNSLQERIAKEMDPSIVEMTITGLGTQLKETTEQLSVLTIKKSTLEAQDVEARKRLTDLDKQMRDLTNETAKVSNDIDQEMMKIEAIVRTSDSEAVTLPAILEALKKTEEYIAVADESAKKSAVLHDNVMRYKKEMDAKYERLGFISKATNVCPLCGNNVGAEKWADIIGAMKAEIAELSTKHEMDRVAMLSLPTTRPKDELQKDADNLKERITKTKLLQDNKPEQVNKYESLKQKKDELLKVLGDKTVHLNTEISEAKNRLNAEVDVLTSQIAGLNTSMATITNSLIDLGAAKSTRASLEKALEDAKSHLEIVKAKFPEMEFIASALAPMGIPLMIVDHYLPVIEQRACELLAVMSNGDLTLTMAVVEAGNKKGVELYVKGDRPIKSLSGGEQTRVSLAIRIALSQILFEMVGNKFDCLLVDEPEYLDDSGIDQFMQSINNLRGLFSQIFVMSHIPKIKASFPQAILVGKQDGISTAVVQ